MMSVRRIQSLALSYLLEEFELSSIHVLVQPWLLNSFRNYLWNPTAIIPRYTPPRHLSSPPPRHAPPHRLPQSRGTWVWNNFVDKSLESGEESGYKWNKDGGQGEVEFRRNSLLSYSIANQHLWSYKGRKRRKRKQNIFGISQWQSCMSGVSTEFAGTFLKGSALHVHPRFVLQYSFVSLKLSSMIINTQVVNVDSLQTACSFQMCEDPYQIPQKNCISSDFFKPESPTIFQIVFLISNGGEAGLLLSYGVPC